MQLSLGLAQLKASQSGETGGEIWYPQLKEGSLCLSLRPYLRWHSITEVATGKTGLAQDEQPLSHLEAAEPRGAGDGAWAWLPAVLWAVSTAATAQTPQAEGAQPLGSEVK